MQRKRHYARSCESQNSLHLSDFQGNLVESTPITDRLTRNLLEILQHSLGCDEFGRGSMYRNHFVTDADGSDGRRCRELVAMGFMRDCGPQGEMTGGMNLYVVTDSGKAAMLRDSPQAPPAKILTRSQARYQQFLRADSGLTFREWLAAGY